VDYFTVATCHPPASTIDALKLKGPLVTQPFACSMQPDKETCVNGGGTCELLRDGFYYVNIICVIFGVVTFVMYIRPKVLHLQSLPLRAWRLAGGR
jgi:MFS transporter, PAT family, solute carrier family 33 (acetyl-CoA transportor), member 1